MVIWLSHEFSGESIVVRDVEKKHLLKLLACFFSGFISPNSLDKDNFKWTQFINSPRCNPKEVCNISSISKPKLEVQLIASWYWAWLNILICEWFQQCMMLDLIYLAAVSDCTLTCQQHIQCTASTLDSRAFVGYFLHGAIIPWMRASYHSWNLKNK